MIEFVLFEFWLLVLVYFVFDYLLCVWLVCVDCLLDGLCGYLVGLLYFFCIELFGMFVVVLLCEYVVYDVEGVFWFSVDLCWV